MNCTLVELVHAMLTASHLPEFLWEPVANHATYVQNRSYMKAVQNKTPYEGWHNIKLNVSCLREFRSPVWILLQGQHMQQKMLPKTTQYYYVGNEDNYQSIIYYNKETQKLNILRNFYFLKDPLENMLNDCTHKGERPGHIPVDTCEINSMDNKQPEAGPNTYKKEERDTQDKKEEYEIIKDKGSKKQIPMPQKRKHKATEPENIDTPQKTRGKCINYRLLENLNGYDDDPELEVQFIETINMAEVGDEFHSLAEAKQSPE